MYGVEDQLKECSKLHCIAFIAFHCTLNALPAMQCNETTALGRRPDYLGRAAIEEFDQSAP
jgi:hypothetical protein